jgi:hypothetical protein
MALNYTGLTPFPNQYRAKLRMSHISSAASDASTGTLCGTQVLYQLNSLYEPLDGNALQPYGFDQLAQLYDRYKVTAVTIQLTAVPAAADGSAAFLHALIQNPDGGKSLTGIAGYYVESFPNGISMPMSGGGGPPSTWTQRIPMHQLVGLTAKEFDANVEEYAAGVAGNPTRMPTLSLAASAISTSINVVYHLVLEFECFFYGRVMQAS